MYLVENREKTEEAAEVSREAKLKSKQVAGNLVQQRGEDPPAISEDIRSNQALS